MSIMDDHAHRLMVESDDYNGWMDPTGKIYPCQYGEHTCLAEELEISDFSDPEQNLERKRWCKLQHGDFIWDFKNPMMPTPTQRKSIIRWCLEHKKEVHISIQVLEGSVFNA